MILRQAGQERLRRWLLAAAAVYTALHVGYSLWRYNVFTGGQQSQDFFRVLDETRTWRTTGSLSLNAVLYPPFYYGLLLPLTYLPFRSVVYLLYFTQFLWYGAALRWMVRAVSPLSRPAAMEYGMAALLLLNFQPFLETLAMHKVEGIEFALICWAIDALRRRRDALTGILVFIAANLKYLPGFLVFYFLAKREWRVLKGMCIAGLIYLAVLIPVFGPAGIKAYVVDYPLTLLVAHRHEGTRMEASMEFQTLTGTVNRWFAGTEGMVEHFKSQGYPPVPQPALATAVAAGLKLILLIGYLWLIRRRWRRAERAAQWPLYLLEISLTLLMIFMLAPASRVHYAILLAPAFIITGLLLYHHHRLFGWTERLLFASAYALTAMLIPGGLLNRLPPHPLWGVKHSFAYLWFSLPFYGYVLLGACVALCHVKLRQQEVGT